MASTPNRVISVSRPGTRSGLRRSHRATTSSAEAPGPTLDPTGLWMPERNSQWAPSSWRVRSPHPEHVGRAVVPVAGQRVAPGERLLVVEDQRLVAGPEVDLVEGVLAGEVDAAGVHEPQGAVDPLGDVLEAPPLGRGGHELLVPGVDLAEVGEPALGEGPQQVEGGHRLLVGGHQPARVGHPCRPLGQVVVDHVAAERVDDLVADAARWASCGAWRTGRRSGRP